MSSDKLTVGTLPSVPQPSAVSSKAPRARGEHDVATATAAVQSQQAKPQDKTPSSDIAAVAHRIENYLKSVNRALEFKVDNASGRTVVTVRDAENGELIRQIPNEEVLRFAQLAEEQTVVLLSEKV